MEPRSVDPSSCWVRHVIRGEEGEESAVQLGRAWFVRSEIVQGTDGLNGGQGWVQAQPTLVLEDDGSWVMTMPNAAGDDGILHRRRFAILTDESYEPGEEWLEFYRDPNDLIFVGTPTDYEKTPSTVVLKGSDLNEVLAGVLSSEIDVWDATAPADVLRHYTRMAVLAYGSDLTETQTGGAGEWSIGYSQALTGVSADCWIAEARLRWVSAQPAALGDGKVKIVIGAGSTIVEVDVFDGTTEVSGSDISGPQFGKRTGLTVPGSVDIRVVVRYDHVFVYVAGELVAEYRRRAPWFDVTAVEVYAYGGTAAIDGLHVETLVDFAGRGPSSVIERQLPGIPPAAGLRGQYWNFAPQVAQYATTAERLCRLWLTLSAEAEPAADRIDPTVNFPSGTASYPPNLPASYAARWSGAIYLDLASSDRNIRLEGLTGDVRLYVGKTLRGDELIDWTVAASLTSGGLREWLETEEAGWYPIVIEQASATAGMILEDRAGSGAYGVVPTSRLSPIGCYSDTVRFTPHRQVYGDVALAFGYQWRVEHRSMESGEFPGQLSFRAQIGRAVNLTIDDELLGSEAQVSGSAGDVIDGMLADAAGIADPKGSGQLTAQVVDYARAKDHLAFRQGYESLSEIGEEGLLESRIDSLLVLRSSPNEQVGVRPTGQRDLVDTFPLTGALARMDWLPGDAPTLKLDNLDVKDEAPRQLTTVTWPLTPNAVGPPTVGFRQRPRSARSALKRLGAAIYGPRLNYQGGVAITTGSLGGATAAGGSVPGAADAYSRASLPTNLKTITSVIAVVHYLTGGNWELEVNGVSMGEGGATDGVVTSPGRYNITRAAIAAVVGSPYIYARLVPEKAEGLIEYLLTLEVWVIV